MVQISAPFRNHAQCVCYELAIQASPRIRVQRRCKPRLALGNAAHRDYGPKAWPVTSDR
jgi:hypothetical protein